MQLTHLWQDDVLGDGAVGVHAADGLIHASGAGRVGRGKLAGSGVDALPRTALTFEREIVIDLCGVQRGGSETHLAPSAAGSTQWGRPGAVAWAVSPALGCASSTS